MGGLEVVEVDYFLRVAAFPPRADIGISIECFNLDDRARRHVGVYLLDFFFRGSGDFRSFYADGSGFLAGNKISVFLERICSP